ncbi:hypothetical protein GCM10008983_23830 [Lentibacillus halophilus]|uniref:Uncharacterized protein n=1 Tax=Lentibacillus halophilus TaxID=295065 RepID=A0ABP3J8D7_9BACI
MYIVYYSKMTRGAKVVTCAIQVREVLLEEGTDPLKFRKFKNIVDPNTNS